MTIVFKNIKDSEKVNGLRKGDDKPKIYDATVKRTTPISDDFEAVLILVPNEIKQKAKQQIDAQTEQTDRIKNRDAILKQAINFEKSNAEKQINELKGKINVSGFQSAFSEYASVSEVGQFLNDVQLGTEETMVALERAYHRQVCAYVLSDMIENSGISEDLDKERVSWRDVLSAYSNT